MKKSRTSNRKRWRRRLLMLFAALIGLAVAGFFTRRSIERSTQKTLIEDARTCLAKKDWKHAQWCLQAALKHEPNNTECMRMMADLMEAAGAQTAVSWRARMAEQEPASAQRRFKWADTAIHFREFNSAADALGGVTDKDRTSARYWKLMGAAAWGRKLTAEAEQSYLKARELEPTNLVTAANLATIHLASNNESVVATAQRTLEELSTNASVHLVALRHLRDHAILTRGTKDAIRYSSQIVRDESSLLGDKLIHLQILRLTGSSHFEPYLDSLKEAATNSSPAAFAIGRWIAQFDSSTNALRWLETLPADVRTNQPVPLLISDCLIAGKEWNELLKLAAAQDWGEAEYYRLAVTALAQKSTGDDAAAKASWEAAFQTAIHHLDRLTRLVQVTRSWHWQNEYEQLLNEVIGSFPREKWAVEALTGTYYEQGNTKAIERVLLASLEANANDMTLKEDLANILLLRKSRLDLAHSLAKEVYQSSPKDPFSVSTYAYSLLLQDKVQESARLIEGIDRASLRKPAIAVYYGAIQARVGHREEARKAIALAEALPVLLPEERTVLRAAKASL